MIENTMKEIRARIQQKTPMTNEMQAELLGLLARLESEITKLSTTHSEHAESIAGFIERSTHEATRRKKHPELLKLSLAGLKESVKDFEASHPLLTADINNICTILANMGI
jgi:hypothetical protein